MNDYGIRLDCRTPKEKKVWWTPQVNLHVVSKSSVRVLWSYTTYGAVNSKSPCNAVSKGQAVEFYYKFNAPSNQGRIASPASECS